MGLAGRKIKKEEKSRLEKREKKRERGDTLFQKKKKSKQPRSYMPVL